jgi:hypothetical protein
MPCKGPRAGGQRSRPVLGAPRRSRVHAHAPHAQPQLGEGRNTTASKHVQGTRNRVDEVADDARVLDTRHEEAVGASLQKRVGPPDRLPKPLVGITDPPPVDVGPGVYHQRDSGRPASFDDRPNSLQLLLQFQERREVAFTGRGRAFRQFGICRILEDCAGGDHDPRRLRNRLRGVTVPCLDVGRDRNRDRARDARRRLRHLAAIEILAVGIAARR